jgi:hypothetical protein
LGGKISSYLVARVIAAPAFLWMRTTILARGVEIDSERDDSKTAGGSKRRYETAKNKFFHDVVVGRIVF